MNSQYRGLAYVVGINTYTQTRKLSNAVFDAQSIAAELKALGFYVIESYDIDFMNFIKQFEDFRSELSKFNVGLFYFAGHGVEFEGKNYLLLTDSSVENKTAIEHSTFDLQSIVSDMHKSGCKMNIQIIDACRDNPYEEVLQQPISLLCLHHKAHSLLIPHHQERQQKMAVWETIVYIREHFFST